MSQVNYLQVGTHVHCLRCHQEVGREEFLEHCAPSGTCPSREQEAKIDYENCAKCLTFKGKL